MGTGDDEDDEGLSRWDDIQVGGGTRVATGGGVFIFYLFTALVFPLVFFFLASGSVVTQTTG